MFEMGLKEEFDWWLDNVEWTDNQFQILKELNEEDKNKIVGAVSNDEELTQEMFRCFEWYLNRYMTCKNERWCK